jgi:C1A family cysteine protease
MAKQKHAFGLLPDPPDEQDYKFKVIRPKLKRAVPTLPKSADLGDLMSPIRDQGQLGACTAFAVGVGLGESIGIEHLRDPFIGLSPLFLYYVTRARARNTKEDTGATLRGTMKTMSKVGTCPETMWPYDIEKFAKRPPIKAYKDTARFQFKNYYRVTDFEDIKIAVAAKNPVALGIMIYSSFETAKVAKDGLVPMPNKRREQLLGGHAVLIMGYDDDKKLVKVRNSWGTSWGDKGYFYLPYDWFDPDQDLASDMWTATL